MAKIAVDIDDTLYSFRDASKDALFFLAQKYDDKEILSAAYTEALQWRTLHDVAGGEILAEAIELAHSPEVMAQQRPYLGASETCVALVREGHELLFISNRDEKSAEPTREWLWDNDFPVRQPPTYGYGNEDSPWANPAELKCLWGDKIPHLSDCQYIIDDRVSTLIRFTTDFVWHRNHDDGQEGSRRIGFGLHAPHNTNLTDVRNVILAPTWYGLNYYLVRKGLLQEPAYDPFGHLRQPA